MCLFSFHFHSFIHLLICTCFGTSYNSNNLLWTHKQSYMEGISALIRDKWDRNLLLYKISQETKHTPGCP